MNDARQNCKFFLLRYVPDAVKNEFVNFGLVLLPPEAPAELRFSKDWSRVQSLDPQADTELLQALRNELGREADQKLILRVIQDSFSNVLQASEHKACLTDSPAQEADELARIYLEAPRRRVSPGKSSRHKILRSMQRAFQERGVWTLMQKRIPASKYSRPGDPLEIDCGYKVESAIKLFHAISLRTDPGAAKVLAFTYPELAAGVLRIEDAEIRLTAIVEDRLEETAQIEFALETLNRAAIAVATVSDLPDLAARAAQEILPSP
jgi:hypothetical protein